MADDWQSDEEQNHAAPQATGGGYGDSGYGGRGRGGGRGGGGGGGGNREPRDGDWTCECGVSNYASRFQCFKCHLDKPGGGDGGGDFGGGRPPRQSRPGDWMCPVDGCGANNFSNKVACFKCGEPKPEGVGETGDGDGGFESRRPPREPRADDWMCPADGCSFSNFANKTACHKCGEPRPEGMGGGERRPPREPRGDDWACPADGCSFSNFANKTACHKCGEPRPEGMGASARPPREPRPGDWVCPEDGCGANNFSNKTECYKCHVPKPEGLDSGIEPGPPRESYVPAEFLEGDAIFDERNQLYEGTGINFKDYDNIAVNASDGNGPLQVVNYQTFSEMGLRPYLVENLIKCKYTKPTPVQRAAIPILLNDRDIMACAQTGSGKTAAFLLPILHKLLSNQAEISQAGVMPATPEALILAPTRELALQIGKEANAYAAGSIVKTKVMYGGVPVYSNKTNLQRGCNICVATPGKLKQLVREGHLSLANVRFFILDEADRMLDMGFMEDVNEIVTTMPGKGDKISGMFSATFPDAIQQVAKKFLEDYVFISVGVVGGACKDVEQVFETLEQKEKRNKLLDILKNTPKDNYKIVVFCGTKKGADFLATVLSDKQISSTSIHGDRLQSQREAALREFASGQRKVLVATAVAARGLDIPKVSMVINYDMPKEIEEYVHRIGRTGRVGHQGKAISFFDLQNDAPIAAPLVDILKGAGQPVPEFLEKIGSSGGGYGGDFGGVDSRGGCENGAAGGGGDDDWD